MTQKFMPEDSSGRIIPIEATSCEPVANLATATIQVLNRTGKTLRLVGFNAMATNGNAAVVGDILNATGTMLSATAAIAVGGFGVARAGTLHASNLTVTNGGTIRFQFANLGAGGLTCVNAQATAYFTVVA